MDSAIHGHWYSKYTDADIARGKLSINRTMWQSAHPEKPSQLTRWPAKAEWIAGRANAEWIRYNNLFDKLNNLQEPRRSSPNRVVVRTSFCRSKRPTTLPCHLIRRSCRRSTVRTRMCASLAELETQYKALKVWSMAETPEYKQDMYGLQTLDKHGGMFLHTAENVAHSCRVKDQPSVTARWPIMFLPVFAKTYYALLAPFTA